MSWGELLAILHDNDDGGDSARPVACPNDGTPLAVDDVGHLFCPFDWWTWPEKVIKTGQ